LLHDLSSRRSCSLTFGKIKMRLPLSPIFLFIPVLALLLGFLAGAMPGGYVVIYLVGIVCCVPNIGFSVGWSRWTAVGLLVIFVVFAQMDHDQGMEYTRKITRQMTLKLNP